MELLSSQKMKWALIVRSYVPAMLAIVVIVSLCAPVMSLRASHYLAISIFVSLVSLILMIPATILQKKIYEGIGVYLDKKRAGQPLTKAELAHAFHSAMAFPQRQFLIAIVLWWIGGTGGAVWLYIQFDDFSIYTTVILASALFSGALTSSIVQYLFSSKFLQSLRVQIARDMHDPQLRRENASWLSMSTKLMISTAGLVLVALVFGVAVARLQGDVNQERMLTHAQADVLVQVVENMEAGIGVEMSANIVRRSSQTLVNGFVLLPKPLIRDFETRVLQGGERADRVIRELQADSPSWIQPLLFEGNTVDENVLYPIEVQSILEAALEEKSGTGTSNQIDTSHIYAWQKLPESDGRILVAMMPLSRVRGEMASSWRVLAFVISVNFLIAILLSRAVAAELSRLTQSVGDRLRIVASGDLSASEIFESDDEFGDLGRSIEEMTLSLRKIVLQVSAAANDIENAARNLATATQGVSESAAEQTVTLGQASQSMDIIGRNIRGISTSAGRLDEAVDGSSQSVGKLRSVGKELDINATDLAEKAESSSASIAEMAQSVRQVAENTNVLSDSAEKAVQSMDRMTMGVLNVQQAAGETENLSVRVVDVAERGRERVQRTIQGIETIREAVGAAQNVVGSLEQRSRKIGEIINVINDVADETNLLALNAAIISAQAGEHGRAFSVVADEIKDLADRVIVSTKEIASVIHALQKEGSQAVGVIEHGANSVQSAVELSAEAGAALEAITDAARESGEKIRGIVSSVDEHRYAASQVVELMEAVNTEVSRIRNAGEEQSRGSQFILEMTHSLVDVAQTVNRITDEQNKSTDHISRSVENVRESSNQINLALREQLDACDQVAGSFASMVERNQLNQDSVSSLDDAVQGLMQQAEALRKHVRRFDTGDSRG